MRFTTYKRPFQRLAALVIGSALMLMGGCPIDRDAVLTETVRAGLQAALDSFIATLARQLAGS